MPGHIVGILSFLRNLYIVLIRCCVILHSHHQCRRVPIFPYPLQHLQFVDIFNDGHSENCEVISYCSFNLHFSILSNIECL